MPGRAMPPSRDRPVTRSCCRAKAPESASPTAASMARCRSLRQLGVSRVNYSSGLYTSGWVLLSGALSQASPLRARPVPAGVRRSHSNAEAALARLLPARRVRSLVRRIRQTMLWRTPRRGLLFKGHDRGDNNRLIYNARNGGIDPVVEKTSRQVSTAIASALNLGGEMFENCTSVIVSSEGAEDQIEHADTDWDNAYSFLIALSPRWIHVKDRDSGLWRVVHLRAGDCLVIASNTRHAAHSHSFLKRRSILLFTAWNWHQSDQVIF